MPVLSKLIPSTGVSALTKLATRQSHDRTLQIRPGVLVWYRFKDLAHFHLFIGGGLLASVAFLTNVFYGKNELRDTPPGYEPHYWEYEKHPISRFIMRYMMVNPQKFYEKKLARLHIESEMRRWNLEEKRVKHLMFERADYKAWYYVPMKAKWVERNRWYFEHVRDNFEFFKHTL